MADLADVEEMERCGDEFCRYDFAEAERIIRTMDCLRSEAVKANIGEIVAIIDAHFHLLVTTYSCILRHETTKLRGNGNVQ